MKVPSTRYLVKFLSRRGDSLFKGAKEAAQNPAHFMRTSKKLRCLRLGKVSSSLCNKNLGFEFSQGPMCVAEEVTKLTRTEMRLPFGNVAGYRHGGTAHLIGQAVNLSLGKVLSRIVERGYQVHRFPPSDQVLVMLGHFFSL